MQLLFARAEIELLLSVLTKPDTPILIAAGVELARFTSYALFPCFVQVVSYLFSFVLEQLHALQDLSGAPVMERSLSGIVSAISVLGIDPSNSQDISQLCTRQAHLATLLRRQRLMEGAAASAKLTAVQARSQLYLLQWCHIGSCLNFEAVCQASASGHHADVQDLLELRSLCTLEMQACPGTLLGLGDAMSAADMQTHPVRLLSNLLRAHTAVQQSIRDAEEAGADAAQASQANALASVASDILQLFVGGLDQSRESICVTDQAWIRSASSALQMLQDSRMRQTGLEAQLRDVQVALQSPPYKDALGALGNEAMLAKTLQEISVEGERLESLRQKAQQELDIFLDRRQKIFSSALGLAQPSLEGSADVLRSCATAVVDPLLHFRKVVGSTKDPRDTSGRGPSSGAALRELRALPTSIGVLFQQCEKWLQSRDALRPAPSQAAPGAGPMADAPPPPPGPSGAAHNIPAPPLTAPPPPPVMPKELDDGDRVTTEAGSSPLSDVDSSQNEDANANEEGSQLVARSETEEEEQLAQDREEVEEEPPANALDHQSQSLEMNASFDEEDASEDDPSDKAESEVAWRAQAVYAVKSISRKIPKANARLDQHAEALIAAATNPDELAQMYEGWTAWI